MDALVVIIKNLPAGKSRRENLNFFPGEAGNDFLIEGD
jgi:hypothetical protein